MINMQSAVNLAADVMSLSYLSREVVKNENKEVGIEICVSSTSLSVSKYHTILYTVDYLYGDTNA